MATLKEVTKQLIDYLPDHAIWDEIDWLFALS